MHPGVPGSRCPSVPLTLGERINPQERGGETLKTIIEGWDLDDRTDRNSCRGEANLKIRCFKVVLGNFTRVL